MSTDPRLDAVRALRNAQEAVRRFADGEGGLVTDSGLPLKSAAHIRPERINWTWKDHIAQAKLNGIVGDGDIGKTTICLDLAARLTRGAAMPDGSIGPAPCSVVFLSGEDGAADTLRPRFDIAGGDPDRLWLIDERAEVPLSIPECIPALEAFVEGYGVRVVFIDPYDAFLTDKANSWNSHHIRRALAPVKAFAERTGVAVVFIVHLNKDEDKGRRNPLYRIMGAVGMANALRMASLVARDPEDEDRRIIAPMKRNLAPNTKALAYRLEGVEGSDHPRVIWQGETDHKVGDLMSAYLDDEQRNTFEEAREFLRATLADGRLEQKEVVRLARQLGISERTLKRAKRDENVQSERDGFGPGSRWYWRLPHATGNAVYAETLALYDESEPEKPHGARVSPKGAKLAEVGPLCPKGAKLADVGPLCENSTVARDSGTESSIEGQTPGYTGGLSREHIIEALDLVPDDSEPPAKPNGDDRARRLGALGLGWDDGT